MPFDVARHEGCFFKQFLDTVFGKDPLSHVVQNPDFFDAPGFGDGHKGCIILMALRNEMIIGMLRIWHSLWY
jgi:hypothetical protein